MNVLLINILIIVALFLMLILILILKKLFREYEIINNAPIIRIGTKAFNLKYSVLSTDKGEVNENWFHQNTLIMGYDKNNQRGEASAEFKFPKINKKILRNEDTSINLFVECDRTHGGLHSAIGPHKKKTRIYLNDKRVDEFSLIQKMPNGEDYGYHNVGPIGISPVHISLKENNVFKFELDDEMAWDIDKVILRITTGKHRLTGVGNMIAGALSSAIIGTVLVLIEKVII